MIKTELFSTILEKNKMTANNQTVGKQTNKQKIWARILMLVAFKKQKAYHR